MLSLELKQVIRSYVLQVRLVATNYDQVCVHLATNVINLKLPWSISVVVLQSLYIKHYEIFVPIIV